MPKRNADQKKDRSLQLKLGLVVKTHRRKLGITQEELAWRANMHRSYIADIERGGRNITLRSIVGLAVALQVPIQNLFARSRSPEEPGEILLVEDNDDDVTLTLRAFERAKFNNPVTVVRDGEAAIDYLFRTGRFATQKSLPLPQLVLLDLNLPKISGLEVLKRIKSDPRTRDIPVVVLTVSRIDRSIIECGQLGVENYIIKPLSFDNFSKVTPRLSLRWALLSPVEGEGTAAFE